MLSQSAEPAGRFTRRDAWRLIGASLLLVVAMSAILGLDFLPAQNQLVVGKPAPASVLAPRPLTYRSTVLTDAARQAERDAVPPQYDFTAAQAEAIAGQQARAFERLVKPIDAAFGDGVTPDDRVTLLEQAVPDLSAEQRATLVALAPERWTVVRTEAARVLDTLLRTELKETQVPVVRSGLAGRMSTDLTVDERQLAAALIGDLVIANSAFDPVLTETRKDQAADAVEPVQRS
jgi:membrane-associated HD superfamily phosphohydrolase